jgi:hypothetical protein
MGTTAPNDGSVRKRLNDRIKRLSDVDWCHRFHFDDSGELVPDETLAYRVQVLKGLFESLFKNQTVLVLNETSGVYPMLAKRAGAATVTANSPNPESVETMRLLSSVTGNSFEVLNRNLVIFEASQIYVALDHKDGYNYLFVPNQIWGLYVTSGHSFADVVEACSHYVTDGLVFDWTDASWVDPPPSRDYSRQTFHDELRERFEYVLSCNDWLTVAVGKLPVEDESPSGLAAPERQRA